MFHYGGRVSRWASAGVMLFMFATTALAGPTAAGATETVGAAAVASSGPGLPVAMAATVDGQGFWVVQANGVITPEGDARSFGDLSATPPQPPVVGIAPTPDGQGYWMVAADGGVFSFGDAAFHGSTGGVRLNQPIVGMALDRATGAYWLVASDGGVFAFDAPYLGSMGGRPLAKPVVAMTATPDGLGYWLVASDGGVFSFGDAGFYGSTGGQPLDAAVVAMTPTPSGNGYWLLGSDGGVFTFGDATFLGSTGGQVDPVPALAFMDTDGAGGYWIGLGTGQVQAFGGATPLSTPPTVDPSACARNPLGRKLLVVSISMQRLWACDGTVLEASSLVTTGASALRDVHDATPTGTWQLFEKTTDVYLDGCDVNGCWHDFVHYWMPFDGPYGFHDAPWQTFPFGSPLYATQGSHGCIHLPEDVAAWVFDWAPLGTTVTVGT